MMREQFYELAFTPSVAAAQARYGARDAYARRASRDADPDAALGEAEGSFLAEQNGFYLATVSETGWPYVQFRGGPRGFLRVTGPRTLAWADFRGNRQYISVGNTDADGRASIIVMDYARQARLKLLGQLKMRDVADAPELADAVALADYKAKVERVAVFDVAAFDWNCPQHITPRFTADELEAVLGPLRTRLATVEAENERLRAAVGDGS